MSKIASLIFFVLVATMATAQPVQSDALALYKSEKYEEAVAILEKKVGRRADENFNLLIDCYKALKRYEDAEKLIKKVVRKTPRPELWVDLGYFQKLQGKAEDANESFDEAIGFINQNPNFAYQLSDEFKNYGLYQRALLCLETAEKANPNMSFHYQKGLLYAELGDVENMYKEYLLLIDQSPSYYNSVRMRISRNISDNPENEANNVLKKQLIKRIQQSENPLYTELLVWLYLEEKSYAQALRQLTALDKREGNRDSEIYKLGNTAQREHAFEVAAESYEYLMKKGEMGAFYQDAIFSKLSNRNEQLEYLPAAKTNDFNKLAKKHIPAFLQLQGSEKLVDAKRQLAAILYFHLAEKDSATQFLNRTINHYESIYPRPVAQCKMLLGDMLLAENQPVEAIFKYMQVERKFSGTPMGDQAKYMKGMVAYYTADFPWALNQFEVLKSSTTKLISNDALQMALLISDNSVEDTLYQGLTYFAKAALYRFRNLPDSALATLDLLLNVFPKHAIKAEATLMQADLLYKTGQFNAAILALENLIENKEGDIWTDDALMQLAAFYTDALGDKEKAMTTYETILFEHPGSTFVPEARRKYRALRGDDLQ